MKLSIIIVNFNTSEDLGNCVESVYKHKPNFDFEIIVVNNSSDPKESEILKSLFGENKQIKLIDVENRGYGAANNAGAKIATGEYLLMLNPDTLVIDDSIDTMIELLEKHDEIGALSPLLYQVDGKTLQKNFYGNFQSLLSVTFRRWKRRKIDLKKEIIYSDIISGAAMLIKRDLFEKLNGFDEQFFMYLEDDDLCFRIKQLGLRCAVYTKAKIIHLEGTSQDNKRRKNIYYESQTKYWYKHNGTLATTMMRILRYPFLLLKKDK